MEAIAFKFSDGRNVPELDTLKNSKVYIIRLKVLNNEPLTREEKNWITKEVNNNSYFRNAIPLYGWRFDFSKVLRPFVVRQYGCWTEHYAVDKTAIRKTFFGRVEKILEIK